MDISGKIAEELGIRKSQAEAAIKLIDEGNTIPFIARYRKEATGELHDDVLRKLDERLSYLRSLDENRNKAIAAIEEQGKLTDELKKAFDKAETLSAIEDLYRPYRKKRRTRAMIAREKGLEPLSVYLLAGGKDILKEAEKYVSEEKEVDSSETALKLAEDIIAEEISDNAAYRAEIRKIFLKKGIVHSEGDPETKSVYENYYDFDEAVRLAKGFRILAINRGEKEKVLKVKILVPDDEIISYLCDSEIRDKKSASAPFIKAAVEDSYTRLIRPSLENEIRNFLTEKAEDSAIEVFKKNLKGLLMQPPIAGLTVLGWDPAFRTGCKLAVVDPTGKVLDTAVIFPTAPTNEKKIGEAKKKFLSLVNKYKVDLVSLGNGTASRESEQLIARWIGEADHKVSYLITNEAGASVYSASELGSEEFPEFDVGQRSSASMARRVQDPLAELVKIDPKSLGVGQYQHDMNQKKLGEALFSVVEDCVNNVGVDLNTASASLLLYVSGLNKTKARSIVKYREEHGKFTDRKELLSVPGIGDKAFELSAGFLRIRDGREKLDSTGIHPESYRAAKAILKDLGISEDEIGKAGPDLEKKIKKECTKEKADEFGIGLPTLKDILKEFIKPGRDPRDELPKPVLRSDVLSMEDLKPGMILKGTVRNVVDFGAFVDIGVHEDGLVHVSKMKAGQFVKDPSDIVHVGDIVEVKVIEVDIERGRISLSMIL